MRSTSLSLALLRIFGPRWRSIVSGIVVATILPLAVFWNQVTFVPERFVEEWLKLMAGGVIIFLVLAVIKAGQEVGAERETIASWLQLSLLAPTEEFVRLLGSTALSKAESEAIHQSCKRMLSRLERGTDPRGFPRELPVGISEAIEALDVDRCRLLLHQVQAAGGFAPKIDPASFAELNDRLVTFRGEVQEALGHSPRSLDTT